MRGGHSGKLWFCKNSGKPLSWWVLKESPQTEMRLWGHTGLVFLSGGGSPEHSAGCGMSGVAASLWPVRSAPAPLRPCRVPQSELVPRPWAPRHKELQRLLVFCLSSLSHSPCRLPVSFSLDEMVGSFLGVLVFYSCCDKLSQTWWL